MRRLIVVTLLLCLSFLAPTVSAQDDCPDGLVCVEYGQDTFELDPDCGSVIAIVIEQTTTTRITLNDPDGVTSISGRALVFTRMDAGGYEVAAIVPVSGVAFGATGCVEWSAADA